MIERRPHEASLSLPSVEDRIERDVLADAYTRLLHDGMREMKEVKVSEFLRALHIVAQEKKIPLQPFKEIQGACLARGGLVRKEAPEKVIALLFGQQAIDVMPKRADGIEHPYANAAVNTFEGLNVVLSEGRQGSKILSVVGFHPHDMTVRAVPHAETDPRDPRRSHLVRSVQGVVSEEDVSFVLFRFPASEVPSEELQEWEVDALEEGTVPFIYRAFLFPNIEQAA